MCEISHRKETLTYVCSKLVPPRIAYFQTAKQNHIHNQVGLLMFLRDPFTYWQLLA